MEARVPSSTVEAVCVRGEEVYRRNVEVRREVAAGAGHREGTAMSVHKHTKKERDKILRDKAKAKKKSKKK